MLKNKINFPNFLTIIRMVMLIPFVTLMLLAFFYANKNMANISYSSFSSKATLTFLISAVIFSLAMLTDFVDGYLARKWKQVTSFGKLFDPLADKIIISIALILLSVFQLVPIYLTIIFVVRDLIVDGSRNLAAMSQKNVAASWWGKAKTMVQSLALLTLFFVFPAFKFQFSDFDFVNPSFVIWMLNLPLICATILSLISGFDYVRQIAPLLKLK